MFRHRQASDPRDKVFGLVGLLASNAQDDEEEPDYSKSTEEIYSQFARSHMNETALCSAEYGVNSSSLNLPSWCPDRSFTELSPVPFQASKTHMNAGAMEKPLSFWKNSDPDLLHLPAWIMDRVKTVGSPSGTTYLEGKNESSWVQLAHESAAGACSRCALVQKLKASTRPGDVSLRETLIPRYGSGMRELKLKRK